MRRRLGSEVEKAAGLVMIVSNRSDRPCFYSCQHMAMIGKEMTHL